MPRPEVCSQQLGDITHTVMEVLNQLEKEKQLRSKAQQHQICNSAKEVISAANTTIIGDYVVGCFSKQDNKWLVQVKGNATLQSLVWDVQHDNLIVDRRYIFLVIGHNQLWTITKGIVVDTLMELVEEIRGRNQAGRIFVSAVLPRLVDNELAKPRLVKLNPALFAAVRRISVKHQKVNFLAVQHHFLIGSIPNQELFMEDKIMPNEKGARVLKAALFNLAGFEMNA